MGGVNETSEAGSEMGALPPSCAPGGPGMTDCGSSNENCCTSLIVPGGTYFRTYDVITIQDPSSGAIEQADASADGAPIVQADPATVSTFRLDKYEVTVGRFRRFVSAWDAGAGWVPPPGSGKHRHLNGGNGLAATGGGYEPGWVTADDGNIAPTNGNLLPGFGTWTASPGTQETLPITMVNWSEAYAFCIWDGGFLPSEAEWEYAAAAGNQQREYPWGSSDPGPSSAIASDPSPNNSYAIYGWHYRSMPGASPSAAPVGTATLGAGLWGQLDLAGNAQEWTLDSYASYANPSIDAANVSASHFRVFRGGYFNGPASGLLVPFRLYSDPLIRDAPNGFRCARIP
jgi:formylglycine-generating enzyme required for sulfatase activity